VGLVPAQAVVPDVVAGVEAEGEAEVEGAAAEDSAISVRRRTLSARTRD